MDLGITDEQRMLIETIERFVADELVPLEDRVEEGGRLEPADARAIFEKSKALGLYATNIPEAHGGGGLSAVESCMAEERFGWTSDILIRRAFGNVYEALLECRGPQVERWLHPTVRGERTCSIAITEPGAGSDAASISTRAVRDGNGWRLTGAKHFVSDGAFSDYYLVSAVTDPERRAVSIFLVDRDLPGVTLGRDQPMMGLRGTSHVELSFDDVRLDGDALLGEEGRGLRLILTTLGRVRLAHVGARAVGKACRAMALMTAHANDRHQFGRPIGDNQMMQQMLADSAMEIEASRLMVLRAAWELDQGRDARTEIAMVKVHATEMLGRVVDRCVQVHGGMGYCRDARVERLYRDARIFRIYDGTSEIHRISVAKDVLGGRWAGGLTRA